MRHPISRLFSLFPQFGFANRRRGPSEGRDSRRDDTVVLYAQIDASELEGESLDEPAPTFAAGSKRSADTSIADAPDKNPAVANGTAIRNTSPPRPSDSHRERLLSMRLSHLRLFGPRRRERLEAAGIVTAGDLLMIDLPEIRRRMGANERTTRWLARHRRAIRLAAAVPGMMPRDALLLTHVHRRSLNGLAAESPAALHRDLERFALSSAGQRLLRGRPVPSVRRVRSWIRASAAVTGNAATTPTRIERSNRHDGKPLHGARSRRGGTPAPFQMEAIAR